VLRAVYGHHNPDFMKGAVKGITPKRNQAKKGPESVAQSVPQQNLSENAKHKAK